MIVLKELQKSYFRGENEVKALRGIDMDIPQGSFNFVVGPSGCGKSTLLYLMGAMDHPDSGSIKIKDVEISSLNQGQLDLFRRNQIGFVFQSFNLIPHLSAVENVLVPMVPTGTAEDHRQEACELLDKFGLGDRLDHSPRELSGGEQQRVAIARAILKKPDLVLADEPTGEMDSKTGKEIFELLRTLNREQGWTFLVVTHDHSYINDDDRIYRLKDGEVLERPEGG